MVSNKCTNSVRKIGNMHPSFLSGINIKRGTDYDEFLSHEKINALLKRNSAAALMHYNCLEWKPTNVFERLEEKETLCHHVSGHLPEMYLPSWCQEHVQKA